MLFSFREGFSLHSPGEKEHEEGVLERGAKRQAQVVQMGGSGWNRSSVIY